MHVPLSFVWFKWHFPFNFEHVSNILVDEKYFNYFCILFFSESFLNEVLVFQSLISCYPFSRPSAIPGPVPDEIVAPATESIGVFQLYCYYTLYSVHFSYHFYAKLDQGSNCC